MRVFVTGTGRCGSVTFSKACGHIKNYTCGHETHTNKRIAGEKAGDILNLDYPPNHIEASSQLAIQIPLLCKKYPDAKWVHLIRLDRDACARSLCRRSDMKAFASYNFLNSHPVRLDVAYAIYDTMTTTIDACLEGRYLSGKAMVIQLENVKADWQGFWNWIDAEGDFDASLAEWDTRYNKGT